MCIYGVRAQHGGNVGRPGQLCYRSRFGLNIGMTLGAVRPHPTCAAGGGRRIRMALAPGVLRAWLRLPADVRGGSSTSGRRLEHPEECCYLSVAWANGRTSAECEGRLRDRLLVMLLDCCYRLPLSGSVLHRHFGGGDDTGAHAPEVAHGIGNPPAAQISSREASLTRCSKRNGQTTTLTLWLAVEAATVLRPTGPTS